MRADRSSATEEATSPRPAAALPGAVKGEDMAKEEVFARSSGVYVGDLGEGGLAIGNGGDSFGNPPFVLTLNWVEVEALCDWLTDRLSEREAVEGVIEDQVRVEVSSCEADYFKPTPKPTRKG